MSSAIHRLSVAEALASLNSRASGLSDEDARQRRVEFGENCLIHARQRPAVVLPVSQLTHFFAVILLAAAALAIFAEQRTPGSGMNTLAAAIVSVILVNGFFSFWEEQRAHRAIAALQGLLPVVVRVKRDGRSVETASAAAIRRGRRCPPPSPSAELPESK